ncbi:MAG: hypothetical protein U0Y08_15665 [Bacteroidia bacterium]
MKNINTLQKTVAAIIVLLLAAVRLNAQDTLIYNNGDKRIVTIIEIGLDEIKFRNINDSSDVIRVLEKEEFKGIHLFSGETLLLNQQPMAARYTPKDMQKTRDIKINFLSPLYNMCTVSYEQMIKPWLNAEAEVGIIGVGLVSSESGGKGYSIRNGIKLLKRPNFKIRGQGLSHPLNGGYFMPEFTFNHYSRNYEYWDYSSGLWGSYATQTQKVKYTNMSFTLTFGKQHYLSAGIMIDYFISVGYNVQLINGKKAVEDPAWDLTTDGGYIDYSPYNFMYGGPDFPIAFTSGVRMGFAF